MTLGKETTRFLGAGIGLIHLCLREFGSPQPITELDWMLMERDLNERSRREEYKLYLAQMHALLQELGRSSGALPAPLPFGMASSNLALDDGRR